MGWQKCSGIKRSYLVNLLVWWRGFHRQEAAN
ncbi:putative transport protein [Shigella sonnei]|nr:putative transport protein [Shigella sonnei]